MSLPLKLALAPLLVAQAVATRRRLPRLPEAEGPRDGVVDGPGTPLRLLIVGDSSAAGVGVERQAQALAGQLAHALAARSGCAVHWQLRARSGLTTAQLLALLDEAPPAPAEVALLVSGVNDVVDLVPPRRAVAARAALQQALAERAGVRHLVITPLPPMHRFAGLPQPLRWLAGRDAAAHQRALARWADGRPGVSQPPVELPLERHLLARDGFHPGPEVYRFWGQALARHIAEDVAPRL